MSQQGMPQVGPTDSVSQGMPNVTPNDSVSQQCLADKRDLTSWQNLPQPVQQPIAKAGPPALHTVQVTVSSSGSDTGLSWHRTLRTWSPCQTGHRTQSRVTSSE